MNHLDIEQFREICEAFEGAGYDVREYSGRGMYGKKCLGVVCGNPLVAYCDAIQEFANMNEDASEVSEFIDTLGHAQMDSMGLSSILYFPHVQWQEENEETEE